MSTLDYILKMPIELPNAGRNDLARWLHELDFKVGVEVGVAAGEYLEILCKENPQMKFYGVDPWLGYKGYADYTLKSTFQKLRSTADERLKTYVNYEFIEKFSMDAVKDFEDESLDFVYIDANHTEPYVTQDITEWSKKVRKGGIVAGHDYIRAAGKNVRFEVKEAVQRYMKENNIKPWFVIGLEAKVEGLVRDASRSWMYVKC